MPGIREVLTRMTAVPGVQTVVAVGRDGLVIEATGQGNQLAHETLGALGASTLGTGEALGQEVAGSPVVTQTLEYENRYVAIFPLGRYAAIVSLAEIGTDVMRLRQAYAAIQTELVQALEAM